MPFGVKVEIQFKDTVDKGANYFYIGNHTTVYKINMYTLKI